MSRSTTGRRLATSICSSIQQASSTPIRCSAQQFSRTFSNSIARLDDANDQARREQQLSGIMGRVRATQTAAQGRAPTYSPSSTASRTARTSPAGKSENMLDLARSLPSANVVMGRALNDQRSVDSSVLNRGGIDELTGDLAPPKAYEEPYHFHVYSHKHNCHVTVTKPNRDAILSLSCGNLGFRHAQRKTYDSAYQLGAYVIDKLQQAGWHNKIDRLEVCLRGWGPGREAVTKVLLGTEGKLWRDKIVKVSDSTRLKFGGTRSPNPRRLG